MPILILSLKIVFYTIASIIILHTIIRIARKIHPFPIPAFLTRLIDNPLRYKMQSPEKFPAIFGVKPGMNILEVGPGFGTFSIEIAKALGVNGHLTCIDISQKVIDGLTDRIAKENVINISPRVESVYSLPFGDASFDIVYLITVIGEISDRMSAYAEMARILKPGGRLIFAELFLDPDYPLSSTLKRQVIPFGFKVVGR